MILGIYIIMQLTVLKVRFLFFLLRMHIWCVMCVCVYIMSRVIYNVSR